MRKGPRTVLKRFFAILFYHYYVHCSNFWTTKLPRTANICNMSFNELAHLGIPSISPWEVTTFGNFEPGPARWKLQMASAYFRVFWNILKWFLLVAWPLHVCWVLLPCGRKAGVFSSNGLIYCIPEKAQKVLRPGSIADSPPECWTPGE